MSTKESKFQLKEHRISIIRRVIQILSFLIINYLILEIILFDLVNLSLLEDLTKLLPVLNTPRNPLSKGAGFLEYIFFIIADGVVPYLLLGILILIFLFTNRFFCGWVCPIGTIQDGIHAIPTKSKKQTGTQTHDALIKLKYFVLTLIFVMVIPLGYTKLTDIEFYFEYRENLGELADKPMSFFSLAEYLFVFLPDMVKDIWANGEPTLEPLFSDFWVFLMFSFYLVMMIVAIWYPRVYCKYFCPLGAFGSIVSRFSFLKLSRSPVRCVGRAECGICERVCPKQIRILDEPFEFFTGKGECNYCLKCKEACPHDAINIKFG